jgi:superfamily II DNA or RNA helicase
MPKANRAGRRAIRKTIENRPYQVANAKQIDEALKLHQRVLYVLPTGGGKTHVAVLAMKRWLRQGKRLLVVAHRRELVQQMYDRLVDNGLSPKKVAVIMAGDERTNCDAPIQIASIQTLTRREVAPDADIVIFDEAHHTGARSWRTLQVRYPKSVGMTATPWRMTGHGLADCFETTSRSSRSAAATSARRTPNG